jgi:ketosteroid isomerase-like protein
MFASTPQHAVEIMDKAFNEGDLDSVLSFYDDRAVVVTEPGKLVRGKQELRRFLGHVMVSKP